MLIDYERLLLDLKAAIASKNSHGQRDLLSLIARLEAEHAIPPDEYERFVRTFGHHLADSFMGLLPRAEEDQDPPTGTAASAPAVICRPRLRSYQRDSEELCQTQIQQAPPPPMHHPQEVARSGHHARAA